LVLAHWEGGRTRRPSRSILRRARRQESALRVPLGLTQPKLWLILRERGVLLREGSSRIHSRIRSISAGEKERPE
jgi:hypothetical protein